MRQFCWMCNSGISLPLDPVCFVWCPCETEREESARRWWGREKERKRGVRLNIERQQKTSHAKWSLSFFLTQNSYIIHCVTVTYLLIIFFFLPTELHEANELSSDSVYESGGELSPTIYNAILRSGWKEKNPQPAFEAAVCLLNRKGPRTMWD